MQDNPLLDIGLPVSLAIIMVGIGISLTKEDFAVQARKPWASVVGSVGQLVLLPLMGIGLALLFDLPPVLAIGLVLVAACPGGSTSNLITFLARGNVALSIILTVISSLAVILTLPLWVNFAVGLVPGAADFEISVPLGQTFGLLFGVILIPVLAGMLLRSRKPELADRLENYVGYVGFAVLFATIGLILWSLRDELGQMIIDSGPAVLALNLGGLAVGALLAWAFGFGAGARIAFAVEFGIKNSTLGILIALTVVGNEELAFPAGVYGVLMFFTALGVVWIGRKVVPGTAESKAETVAG